MNSPAFMQYRARRLSRSVAAPLAAWFAVAGLYAVGYFGWFVPELGSGERASERYLDAVRAGERENKNPAAALWEDLTRKHGGIRDYRRVYSHLTHAPMVRTRHQCGYDLTMADGAHVLVRVELKPRHFGSVEWSVDAVVAPPLPKGIKFGTFPPPPPDPKRGELSKGVRG
jgi:hypothetical protein